MGTKERDLWESLAPDEQDEFWKGMSASEQAAFMAAMEGGRSAQESHGGSTVKERPRVTVSIGIARQLILATVLVVGFCSTWWLVAGESWQTRDLLRRAKSQTIVQQQDFKESHPDAVGIDYIQNLANTRDADSISRESFIADAHFRTQMAWGLGAGLLVDVLLLTGLLAWQKVTVK